MRLRIDPETTADIPAIRGVLLAAFTDEPGVADLVDVIRASPQYEPALALVARVDADVAGFVMISHATLVDDGGAAGDRGGCRHDVLTLSPLAVAPDRQRQGVGAALVRAALAAAESTDAPLVTLEGSPTYYGRFGFRPAADVGIGIHLPDWAPPDAAQFFPLPRYRPDVRGRVQYPPAFDIVT